MSATGRGAVRVPNDYYGTPSWAVDAILPLIPLAGRVLDAGAGEGQIASRLLAFGVRPENCLAVEIDPERAAVCREVCPKVRVIEADYLGVGIPNLATVIANPPYNVADQPGCTALAFVEKSLDLVGYAGTVAMLLRLNWLEGAQVDEPARLELLRERMPDVHVLSRRPQFGLNKHGKKGGDSCAYAWMVWGPGRGGRISMLHVPTVRALTRGAS